MPKNKGVRNMDFDLENKNVQIIIGAVAAILVLILLVGLITKGPRERAQVKQLRRTMSMLNQAVVIQNRISNGTFASKDRAQLISVFSTRLRATKKGEDYFVLKNGAAVYIKDVNPKCSPDGADKCADIIVKLKGKRGSNKISTTKKLTGTYALELRAKRVFPAVGTETEQIIRTKR